jgi:hypothetical protein
MFESRNASDELASCSIENNVDLVPSAFDSSPLRLCSGARKYRTLSEYILADNIYMAGNARRLVRATGCAILQA